ncbi:MAG: MATE family efflux transporter [Candidatus Izemoplasmatales bacterium]|jgi:putative MATE family efflux protein|nr:MATE family efflux transporter [Candidatus Izemoplasmatales bacterium]
MSTILDKKTEIILYRDPIWKGLIYLSFPVFLVNILKTLHDIVDGIFLGMVEGTTDAGTSLATSMQSAVALTWPIFFIFISFGMGLSVAGNALIGQYVGKGDYETAKKYSNNTVFIALFLGVVFTIVAFSLAPYILKLMGAEGSDLTFAITYLRIRSFELPILFLIFAFEAVRRATGDTVTPVIVNAIGIVLNIILTPLLVLTFNLGVTGAALSTVLAHVTILPAVIFFLLKSKKSLTVNFNIKQLNKTIVKDIFDIGIPASAGQSIQAVGFVILNSLIYAYGTNVSAAFFIGNRISSLVMFPVSAVSSIVAIYIAQNVGAENVPRAKKSVRQGIIMSVLMMVIGISILLPLSEFIVNLFSNDKDTIDFAKTYVFWIGIGLPLMALFQVYLSAFQGSGETKKSFVLAITRLWVLRLPLILLANKYTDLGPMGIWYAMLISNILAALVGAYLYSKVKFLPKTRKVV